MSDPTKERTFIAVKPDGVQRGLTGEIIKRFERRGYKLVACKMIHVSSSKVNNYDEYPQHVDRSESEPITFLYFWGSKLTSK